MKILIASNFRFFFLISNGSFLGGKLERKVVVLLLLFWKEEDLEK